MVQELFNKNVFAYIMLGLGGLGVLLKILLHIQYIRLVKASDNMGTSKNKLTQTMKLKFESCYKLKIGVNNVDIFVDKYVYHHKFGGLFLSTWENIGGQVLVLCLLTGSISSILGLIYECGKQQILSTFSVGILISGLLIFLEGMINIHGKRELIRINMKDYLENLYKVRLEHPEIFEQYKTEHVENETANVILKRTAQAPTRMERAMQKSEMRARKQQAQKYAKAKKKEEAAAKKRFVRETRERLKQEEKLAIERKREEDRMELEQRKAEAKAAEQRKREEKIRQEEIKKALLLEKQAVKEDKPKKTGEHLTIAQARKESLKKEIQGRREMEQVVKTEINNEMIPEPANTDLNYIAPKQNINTVQDNISAAVPLDAESSANAINKTSGNRIRPSRKGKPIDYLEEKIIADTLKEFLA
jgi:hypothetical protein